MTNNTDKEVELEWGSGSTHRTRTSKGAILASAFFNHFPHPIIKQNAIFQNEALTENVYWWTGKYWRPFKPLDLEGKLNDILLNDLGIEETCRKNDMKKTFLAEHSIPQEELNIEGENLFCCESGVIDLISLREIYESSEKEFSIETLYERKSDWLFPHEMYKDNHITCFAPISIPDIFNKEQFEEDMSFFRNTFLKSMGNREDSFEWLMDLFSACLSGERKGDHFTSLYGAPASGKTTLMKFASSVFGDQYARTIEPEDLAGKSPAAIKRFYRSRFARYINVSETADKKLNSSFLKKLTGKSNILVGYDGETMELNAHIIVDSNHLIESDETDAAAFLRRYIVIPFGPKIDESQQDKHLAEKLEKIKQSFFLELIFRFPKLKVSELSAPEITNEVLTTAKTFKEPVRFFLDTCTVPALKIHGGRDVKIAELYRLYKQNFSYIYEARFNNIFYRTDDFHVNLPEIGRQKFTIEVEKVYHNITSDHKGKELCVNNLIVRDPGAYTTVKKMQIEQLQKVYCVASNEEEALALIEETEKPCLVSLPDDPNDTGFADIIWYEGCPSFTWLHVVPNQLMWENQILRIICFKNLPNMFGLFGQFQQWLAIAIGYEKGCEIFSDLCNQLSLCGNYEMALCNTEVRKILSGFFDIYRKYVQNITPVKKLQTSVKPRFHNETKKIGAIPFSINKNLNGIEYSDVELLNQ